MTHSLTLPVTGMTCGGCVSRVEQTLQNQEGVASAEVNFATKSARVTADEPLSVTALSDALASSGYGVETEDLIFDVENLSCASCVARVEAAMSDVPGVQSANVNFANGQARVRGVAGVMTPKALIDASENPDDILAAVDAYRKRVAGFDQQRIKLSQNFFADDFWRTHVPAASVKADPIKVLQARAADIRAQKPWARTILPSQAGECIQANLITVAECQAAGINV